MNTGKISILEIFTVSGSNTDFYSLCMHRLMQYALFISHFKYEGSLVE